MGRKLESGLKEIEARLAEMSDAVEQAIDHALAGLAQGSQLRLSRVFEIEKMVNRYHKDMDDLCVSLIALQQPVAEDLRFVVGVIKINTDLERMGDHAVNIALCAERYAKAAPLKKRNDIALMGDEVKLMVREALDSFVKRSPDLAQFVLKRDDQIDLLKDKVMDEMVQEIRDNGAMVDQGLNLILIARNLEKIGDHACNIAEDVIYVVSGKDIRHPRNVTLVAGGSGS